MLEIRLPADSSSPVKSPTSLKNPATSTITEMELKPQHARSTGIASTSANQMASSRGQTGPQKEVVETVSINTVCSPLSRHLTQHFASI